MKDLTRQRSDTISEQVKFSNQLTALLDYEAACELLHVARSAYYNLNRHFHAEKPNEKWLTDVTEFKWYEGITAHMLHLSAILDL
ncbi:MAG: hypothetical protein HFF52_01805 [Lawsonibacter sp.]|nr:hypothetical protein [Lawsonibacter sp.]